MKKGGNEFSYHCKITNMNSEYDVRHEEVISCSKSLPYYIAVLVNLITIHVVLITASDMVIWS